MKAFARISAGFPAVLLSCLALVARADADTSPPTNPTGLLALAASGSLVNLSWSASTDDVGVTGYLIERCAGTQCTNFTQITIVSATSYQDSGLSQGSAYTYRVRATDAANNLSGYSNIAADSTFAPTPSFVQGNSAVVSGAASVSAVSAAYQSAQVAGHLNLVFIGWANSVNVQSVTDSSGNVYQQAITNNGYYSVWASTYYAYNIAPAAAGANTVTVAFSAAATQPDVRILEFSGVVTANPLDGASANIGWGYTVDSGSLTTTVPDDLIVASPYAAGMNARGGGDGFTVIFSSPWHGVETANAPTVVGNYDAVAAGAWSPMVMHEVAFKPEELDTTAPAAPGGLVATAASGKQINLLWVSAAGNPSAYVVERCQGVGCSNFTPIAVNTTGNFNDALALTPSTVYGYRIRARNAAGNYGDYSSTVTATTLASDPASDTTPPAIPAGVTVTAVASTQVSFNWTPASDNVAVSRYLVESCQGASCTNFAQVATTSIPSVTVAGLSTGTTYSFRVRAIDAAGNLGSYSILMTVVTSATGSVCTP
jgi:chitodextrinase